MTLTNRFIIKLVVLLISQKDYEHYPVKNLDIVLRPVAVINKLKLSGSRCHPRTCFRKCKLVSAKAVSRDPGT